QIQDLPWELDLVGDGEERGSLEEAFTKAGLSGRVRFHGWLDQPAVEEKLRHAEIFILPSLVEGLSVSALEALKFGLLLVGSDIPTLHECVTSGINGYLLSLQTPDQWIEKLRTLLSDPERRLAMRRSSWKIVERFDLEQIADRYEELFRQVVSRTSRFAR
ncbi:MAG: glycosyltransferase family 4 protein, partial [Verrucomicrobia bacterium]|nr:glycosyltransferase family 4 protein [Verrucomicrobiota bacterium]